MRRREFIGLVGGAAAWSVAAKAQPADKIRRIGVLTGFAQDDSVGQSFLAAFREQLAELGWIEGRDIHIEIRWGDGADPERIRASAIELTRMMPDVIVVHGSRTLTAVRRETDRIPILFASVTDPVTSGYVESLARPGGNVTGFTVYSGFPAQKLMQMLKELVPSITRIAFIATPDYLAQAIQLKELESAAQLFAVKITPMLLRNPAAIAPAIADFAQEPDGGLVVPSDVFMITHRNLIIAAAARHRLPAIYQDRSFVADGGLISYSVDRREQYRRVATYVDRIFKGAKPADLPVQQPTKFEFVLNQKTATALGITVPRIVLVRTDEVVE